MAAAVASCGLVGASDPDSKTCLGLHIVACSESGLNFGTLLGGKLAQKLDGLGATVGAIRMVDAVCSIICVDVLAQQIVDEASAVGLCLEFGIPVDGEHAADDGEEDGVFQHTPLARRLKLVAWQNPEEHGKCVSTIFTE